MNEDNRKQYINWLDPNAFVDNMWLVYMHYIVQGHKWEKKNSTEEKIFKEKQRTEKNILQTEGNVNTVWASHKHYYLRDI